MQTGAVRGAAEADRGGVRDKVVVGVAAEATEYGGRRGADHDDEVPRVAHLGPDGAVVRQLLVQEEGARAQDDGHQDEEHHLRDGRVLEADGHAELELALRAEAHLDDLLALPRARADRGPLQVLAQHHGARAEKVAAAHACV